MAHHLSERLLTERIEGAGLRLTLPTMVQASLHVRSLGTIRRGLPRGDSGRPHVTASMSGAIRVQPSGSAGGRSPDEDARDGPKRPARSGDAANAFAVPIGKGIGD